MNPFSVKIKCLLAFVIGGLLAVTPVMADKPEWAGGGKGKSGRDDRADRRDDRRGEHGGARGERDGRRPHFEERHNVVVREYYTGNYQGGRCPPGLAKKHNGCMPPGQAKKWKYGKPLPASVVYYEVPPQLVTRLPPAPRGHRYVRVAGDILLIAVGTAIVIDAIEDLGRM
jgi:Ni/Co efflux regulator RcnB